MASCADSEQQGLLLIALADRVDGVDERLTRLAGDVGRVQGEMRSVQTPAISLTERVFQPVGDGFAIAIKDIKPELTGLRFDGLLLNKSSVTVENQEVTLRLGGSSATFILRRASAGSAAKFSVYVPDVPVAASSGVADVVFGAATLRFAGEP